MSAAVLTAPKLPEVFCDRNVRPCEPVSVNCPSEPEKLHCLGLIQINESSRPINSNHSPNTAWSSRGQQTVSKEACELFLKVALFQEFHSYFKNANHSIENLTNNGELETCDRQLLLIQHQPRLRTYLTVL